MNIGIVGARKYKDKSPVIELVNSLPADSVIGDILSISPAIYGF